MAGFLSVGLGVIGLIALLVFERLENPRMRLSWKTFTSACFILCALSQGINGRYDVLVLVGLVFGFLGDVLLALRGKTAFLAGMIAFAVGHGLYAVAFVALVASDPFPRAYIALIGLVGCGALAWLWPHLGVMRVPVSVYIIIIAVMLIAATGTLTLEGQGRWMIVSGAASFAVSDVFVARNRFVDSSFINKLLGLPLYYAGQFLIALSVGFF